MIRTLILIIVVLNCSCEDSTKFENAETPMLDLISVNTDCSVGETDSIVDGVYYSLIEEMPEFGNGIEDLIKYIKDNAVYPQSAIDDNIEGRVYIQIVINEDGSVSSPVVLRGISPDIDDECMRVVRNMPNWKPGKVKGKTVKVRYYLPFRFKLNSDIENSTSITPSKNRLESSIVFKVYPNPATSSVKFEVTEFNIDLEYQIINMNGRVVKRGNFNNKTEQIEISDLENGIYIVQLLSKENGLLKTQKLIKK